MVDKLDERRSGEIIGDSVGESERQIQRYIRLTELVPDMLDLVDDGKIALRPAYEISFLTKDEQEMVYQQIADCEYNYNYIIPFLVSISCILSYCLSLYDISITFILFFSV